MKFVMQCIIPRALNLSRQSFLGILWRSRVRCILEWRIIHTNSLILSMLVCNLLLLSSVYGHFIKPGSPNWSPIDIRAQKAGKQMDNFPPQLMFVDLYLMFHLEKKMFTFSKLPWKSIKLNQLYYYNVLKKISQHWVDYNWLVDLRVEISKILFFLW